MNALKESLEIKVSYDETDFLTLSNIPEEHVVEFIGRKLDNTLFVLCRPDGEFGNVHSLKLYVGKDTQLKEVGLTDKSVSAGELVLHYRMGSEQRVLRIPNQYSIENPSDDLFVRMQANRVPPYYDTRDYLTRCRKAKIN